MESSLRISCHVCMPTVTVIRDHNYLIFMSRVYIIHCGSYHIIIPVLFN